MERQPWLTGGGFTRLISSPDATAAATAALSTWGFSSTLAAIVDCHVRKCSHSRPVVVVWKKLPSRRHVTFRILDLSSATLQQTGETKYGVFVFVSL